jgi:hypothetical protein
MPSDLHLLKTNAILHLPTDEKPYYEISMTSLDGKCTIQIAATKPLPSQTLDPRHPAYEKIKPVQYVSFTHDGSCGCASFSKDAKVLFEAWQHIHLTLRYKGKDNASYAFYPEFEYESGEALAHASLVASLALGRTVPECYHNLIENFGATVLQEALRKEQRGEHVEIINDGEGPLNYLARLTI